MFGEDPLFIYLYIFIYIYIKIYILLNLYMYDMIPSVYVSVPPRILVSTGRWLAEALLTKLPSMEAHLATWPLSEFWRLDGLNGLQIGVILTIDIHWDDPPSRCQVGGCSFLVSPPFFWFPKMWWHRLELDGGQSCDSL